MKTLILVGMILIASEAASAQSTATYEYDALGRLTVSRRGTSNVETTIEYDRAGNRTAYKVTGAPSGDDSGSGAGVPATRRFVIVPLNGFTVIPIG